MVSQALAANTFTGTGFISAVAGLKVLILLTFHISLLSFTWPDSKYTILQIRKRIKYYCSRLKGIFVFKGRTVYQPRGSQARDFSCGIKSCG
jgi:hypothetical protein